MENNSDIYYSIPLFAGLGEHEISALFTALPPKRRSYRAGDTVFWDGCAAEYVGIVLDGTVHIVKEDFFGNRNIVAAIDKGGIFAEAFVCAKSKTLPVSVFAASDCDILLIDYKSILDPTRSDVPCRDLLILNMLRIMAERNIMLSGKIELTARRTTREKLTAYLSSQAKRAGDAEFEIPFNRQELADYLSVDRSAMSAELGRMRRDGLIEFRKNRFRINPIP